jgi:hypothetical protein
VNSDDLITLDELEAAGLTAADVRDRCPWAVEHTGLDGGACWQRDELVAPLLGETDRRDP